MRALPLAPVLSLAVALAVVALAPVLGAQAPSRDPRTILGRTRSEIELARRPVTIREDGTLYGEGILVRYDAGDVAVEMIVTLPAGVGCSDVPAWLGIPRIPGSFPLRRHDGCSWPGTSTRSVLASGLAAETRGRELRIRRITRGSAGSP